jgi:hypothetical protein
MHLLDGISGGLGSSGVAAGENNVLWVVFAEGKKDLAA